MNKKKNLVTALFFQCITMLSGLILPRIIISTFGSEINGLLSSITQFLSFISLLEGGLGAVVLAELYKPIEENNNEKINSILNSCQTFFTNLSVIFMIYTVVLGVVYGWMFREKYSFCFVCSLVFILSFTTLAQYLFSITYKLLLQAQKKIYIVNTVSAITVIVNLFLSIILIYIFPKIHAIKLGSAVVFLLQPLIFKYCIEKKYRKEIWKNEKSVYKMKKRWDGFAQNLAHFVNLNTDIAVITIFLSLIDVSVYTVYMLPITALRLIISSLTNSYQSALGKYYAQGEQKELKSNFEKFNNFNIIISIALFSTCVLLINPFVQLYTQGINDADYFQPVFAVIIVLANMFFCLREPYRYLILAAGKFKETNFGAILEAIINIVVSIVLIKKYKLIGIAFGTLLAIIYRFISFIIFFKNDILFKNYKCYFCNLFKLIVMIGINLIVYFEYTFKIDNFVYFCIYGGIIFIIEIVVAYIMFSYSITRKKWVSF